MTNTTIAQPKKPSGWRLFGISAFSSLVSFGVWYSAYLATKPFMGDFEILGWICYFVLTAISVFMIQGFLSRKYYSEPLKVYTAEMQRQEAEVQARHLARLDALRNSNFQRLAEMEAEELLSGTEVQPLKRRKI